MYCNIVGAVCQLNFEIYYVKELKFMCKMPEFVINIQNLNRNFYKSDIKTLLKILEKH